MHYRFIWVGRKARDPLLQATDTYIERLGHYAQATLVKIRESTIEGEGRDILAKVGAPHRLVVMDERGEHISTQDIAQNIDAWRANGMRDVAFVIGGANGLHDSLRQKADACWALSKLTLPHRMAQVLLAEQLYRAHTILKGEQYHRV